MLDSTTNSGRPEGGDRGSDTEQPSHAVGEGESEDSYIPPERSVEPLTGKGPLPLVKRFNRWTVAVLLLAVAAAAVLAFGRALTRDPPTQKADPAAAETTVAAPSATDVINHLPGTYADVPQLGKPMPGEIGSMAAGNSTLLEAGAAGSPPMMPVSYGMQPPIRPLVVSAEAKLAERAREAGFGFGGGSTASGGDGADRLAGFGGTVPVAGAAPMQKGDRDADNRQDDKQEFLERNRTPRWELKDRLHRPASLYTLFAGTVISGVLITGINSDLPGQIEGQISQNVYDTVRGAHLILPQGTKLLGSYDSRITYGQSRVLVVWTRIIRPDGSNIDLEGMPGVDLSGYSGVTGNVDRHLSRILTAVLLGSVIQAGTAAGTSYTDPTFAGLARQGAGQGINEATQQIVRKELLLQPTIKVKPGERFAVFTTKDITIPPYDG